MTDQVYMKDSDSDESDEYESEDSENMEKDHEMIYQQLSNLKANVCALMRQCECGAKQLTEAWVQAKITLADDYVDTVHDYIVNGGHDMKAGQDESDDVAFVVAVEKAMSSNGRRPA